MNRIVRLVALTLLLLLGGTIAEAQYTVKPGDTLYMLAGQNMGDSELWNKLYEQNPFLHEPGRRFVRNGMTIVVIRPGEVLQGLTALGIVDSPFNDVSAERLAQDAARNTKEVVRVEIQKMPDWVLWLLAILFGTLFWLAWRYFSRDNRPENEGRDPVTSGEPFVPGGVTDATAPGHFQEMAGRAWLRETGRMPASNSLFTILRTTAGRGWGRMIVQYRDGNEQTHRLNGERVYEAMVRFPDGNEETLYMLQGCGNDLRSGHVVDYRVEDAFRFEPDVVTPVVPAPQPVAEPAVVPAVVADETQVVEDGTVRIQIRPAEGDRPAMVEMRGVDETGVNSVEIKSGSVTIRYTPRGARQPRLDGV